MRKRRVLPAAALAVAAYFAWAGSGRTPPPPDEIDLYLAEAGIASFGDDAGAGNLLAIQPYLEAVDYSSDFRFLGKLTGYLAAARARGFLGPKTVVVLPEHLGTFLVALGEKRSVFEAPAIDAAMTTVVLSNLPSFLWNLARASRADERAKAAIFRMKAPRMAAAYQRALSTLARDHGVTVVGGSIVLPDPRVEEGRLVAGDGPLVNVSAVFRPDGAIEPALVRKCYPVSSERPFCAAGRVEDIPVFETPAGRLGVLICADSWFPDAHRALAARRVDLVAVPSYIDQDGAWERPWGGYDGPAPAEVDPADPGRITEGEAWAKYALGGRIALSGARAGVNVFLRGRLWDSGGDGQSYAVTPAGTARGPHVDGAALLDVRLPPPAAR